MKRTSLFAHSAPLSVALLLLTGLAPAPAVANDSCIECPLGTLPLIDANGDNSGWCLSISRPENVVVTIVDVDLVGNMLVLQLDKDFTGPPGAGYVFSPILLDFFQVCHDSETVGTIVIDAETIDNLTTSAWTGFDWILFDYGDVTPAWFDVAASSGFDTAPFSAAFSGFLDPGTDNEALLLTAGDGAVGDQEGFAPGQSSGALVIQTDTAVRPTPLSFTLKQRPTFVVTSGDLDLDGDIDLTDFANFAMCFDGPNRGASANCPRDVSADLDGDGDVDLGDYAVLSTNFTGAR
jgi:hypothetical protein